MRFTYFWPGWAVALGIGVVIGITVFVYFRVARQMHPGYRVLLVGLRIFAASILLGCLLAPIVIEQKDITPPTHLSILVDTSRSMELVDAPTAETAKSRLSQVNQLLFDVPGEFLQSLRDRFEVHLYPFDTGLHQSVPFTQDADAEMPRFKPEGSLTNIDDAIREAAAMWKGQQSAGILLITDGGHNSGQFPFAAMTALEVPIYAIGVGDTEPPKDIQIQHVDYAPVAYTGHESIVRVNVTQTGYTGKTTRLSLRQLNENTLIDAATLTFGAETETVQTDATTKQVIELKLTPQTEGNFQYTVTLPALDGELTEANNQKTFSVKVVKAKLNVFYLEGKPRWDYTFLKRTLTRDPDIEATCAVLSRGGSKRMPADAAIKRLDGYYPQTAPASQTPRFPETQAELSKYDVLILGDLGEAHLTKAQQLAIVDFVEVQGKPIIFLPSRNMLGVNGLRNTELAQLLPVDIPASGCRIHDTEFTVQLTQSGVFHPILQLGDSPSGRRNDAEIPIGNNATLWQNIPVSLSRFFSGFRLRGGATVLMESGKGTPVLMLQRSGLGKSLLIAAEGLWNWDFGVKPFKDSRYRAIYPRFWTQVIRWMATDTDDEKLYLSTDAETYTIGDTAKVTAYLYSETYQQRPADARIQMEVIPPEGTSFRLQIRSATGNANARATADIGNLYTAQFELRQKGTYRIKAVGRSGNLTLGEDHIDIYAHPQLAECGGTATQ